MDPIDAFDLFGDIGPLVGFDAPDSSEEFLGQTVGDYRALLDLVEQSVSTLNSASFAALLSSPVANEFDAETRAFIEQFAAGDFSMITEGVAEARAAIAPFADDVVLGQALGGIDTGGDDAAAIQQAVIQAQAELAALLWGGVDGTFDSPSFSLNLTDGSWFADNGSGQPAYSGTTLAEFYSSIGDAVSNALLAFIGSDQSVLDALTAQGATANDLEAAKVAANFAASQLVNSLQTFSSELVNDPNASPVIQEAVALGAYSIFTSALNGTLPGASAAIADFILGSRNTDNSFVASFTGTVSGSEQDDWFFLSAAGDSFDGGAGADVLFGLAGDDSFVGGADNDYLFGGDGTGDTASYAGGLGQFSIQMAADGSVSVVDRTGAEGTDVITGIEQLSFASGASLFANGLIDLTKFQGITGLNSEQINTFVELYIAYFNRAPDAIGLNFWGTAFATGTSLEEIASLFLDQDETRATYPADATNLAFATQVYSNVLGRAADQGGLDFWTGQLDSGAVSRGAFILEVLRGAKADPADGASQEFIDLQLADRAYLETKTDIGTYFSVINGLSDVADASTVMQLFVRGDTSSITAAIDRVDAESAEAVTDGSGEFLMPLVGVTEDPFAV